MGDYGIDEYRPKRTDELHGCSYTQGSTDQVAVDGRLASLVVSIFVFPLHFVCKDTKRKGKFAREIENIHSTCRACTPPETKERTG